MSFAINLHQWKLLNLVTENWLNGDLFRSISFSFVRVITYKISVSSLCSNILFIFVPCPSFYAEFCQFYFSPLIRCLPTQTFFYSFSSILPPRNIYWCHVWKSQNFSPVYLNFLQSNAFRFFNTLFQCHNLIFFVRPFFQFLSNRCLYPLIYFYVVLKMHIISYLYFSWVHL